MWVDYKPVDVEIDDDNTEISVYLERGLECSEIPVGKIPVLSSSISTSTAYNRP